MTNNITRIREPRIASGESASRRVEASTFMQEEWGRPPDVDINNGFIPWSRMENEIEVDRTVIGKDEMKIDNFRTRGSIE